MRRGLLSLVVVSLSLHVCSQSLADSLIINALDSFVLRTDDCRAEVIDKIIFYGESFLGQRYKYGGTSPETGFDCSGFMYHIHNFNGVLLPRGSSEAAVLGQKIVRDSVRRGDLVYFQTRSRRRNAIGHVAIVTAKTDTSFVMLHAVPHGGVVEEEYGKMSYYVTRYLFAMRLPDNFYCRLR